MNQKFTTVIQFLIKDIIDRLYKINFELSHILVSLPPKKDMGDIAISASFVLAKQLKKSPIAIADELIEELKKIEYIDKVENLNGFLNITFKDEFFIDLFKKMALDTKHFEFPQQNINVNLEYISANPTGPLHIGHGRWAALGDSIARLLTRGGFNVTKEFWINDAGVQIEKLHESVQALKNNQPIPEGGYHGEYLKDALNSDLEPDKFFLEQHKQLLSKMGVFMDKYSSEKETIGGDKLLNVIESIRKKGYIYEKEGATWFESSKLGDDKDRPVIKSDGNFTYFSSDFAYTDDKINRGFNWIIIIVGADHHGWVKRMEALVDVLSGGKVKFTVLLGQLVNLYKNGEPVRMSKRSGNVVMLEDVVDDIGVDATRFMLVTRRYNQMIDFDLDVVKKQTKDNPLFYIQYAFARIQSIKSKVKAQGITIDNSLPLLEESEKSLIIKALFYKEELQEAIKEMEPQKVASYLFEIASLFHKFYEKNRVIENDTVVQRRLDLIEGIGNIIKDGLFLLGIDAQDKM